MDDGMEWVSVSEAARRLGVSRAAIRGRIERGTIDHQLDNHGHPLVRLALPVTGTVPSGMERNMARSTLPPRRHKGSPPPVQDAPDTIPAPAMRDTVDRIQAAHNAALAAAQEQVERVRADMAKQAAQHRTDIAEQQARADAQAARQLAERDALHLDAIGRMQAQTAVERSLWLERVDAYGATI